MAEDDDGGSEHKPSTEAPSVPRRDLSVFDKVMNTRLRQTEDDTPVVDNTPSEK